MASDWPGGAVLAAALRRGAPGRPLAGGALWATDFLPGAFLAVDKVDESATTPLVGDAFPETDFLLPFAGCFLASLPLRPVVDSRDDFFAAPRLLDSTRTLGPDDSSFLRTRTCRP